MILPPLEKGDKIPSDGFYFACDSVYLDLYGKALALSIIKNSPWANVHIHLFNPTSPQLDWCNRQKNISYSWENKLDIPKNLKATYYACIRFSRIPQIFSPKNRVISFDCDMLMNRPISKEFFYEETKVSKVTCKPKNGNSLASSIIFADDNFRNEYADCITEQFTKNNIYWFLDQDILNDLIKQGRVKTMGFQWTGLTFKEKDLMWTAKGNRKNSKQQYVDAVKFYNDQAKKL